MAMAPLQRVEVDDDATNGRSRGNRGADLSTRRPEPSRTRSSDRLAVTRSRRRRRSRGRRFAGRDRGDARARERADDARKMAGICIQCAKCFKILSDSTALVLSDAAKNILAVKGASCVVVDEVRAVAERDARRRRPSRRRAAERSIARSNPIGFPRGCRAVPTIDRESNIRGRRLPPSDPPPPPPRPNHRDRRRRGSRTRPTAATASTPARDARTATRSSVACTTASAKRTLACAIYSASTPPPCARTSSGRTSSSARGTSRRRRSVAVVVTEVKGAFRSTRTACGG